MLVTVTWVDNNPDGSIRQKAYNCEGWRMIDGVLWLQHLDIWTCIPHDVNVREWTMQPDNEQDRKTLPEKTL